jgi:hypothetical protein
MPSSKAQKEEKELERSGPWEKLKVYLSALGSGLITGASDDDPSGIGTYSQTGAQFRYAQQRLSAEPRRDSGWNLPVSSVVLKHLVEIVHQFR